MAERVDCTRYVRGRKQNKRNILCLGWVWGGDLRTFKQGSFLVRVWELCKILGIANIESEYTKAHKKLLNKKAPYKDSIDIGKEVK